VSSSKGDLCPFTHDLQILDASGGGINGAYVDLIGNELTFPWLSGSAPNYMIQTDDAATYADPENDPVEFRCRVIAYPSGSTLGSTDSIYSNFWV